jgi:hypothetical protein
MDTTMEEMVTKGHESLLMLNELSQYAALLRKLGNLYNERYFHKSEYRKIDTLKSSFESVMHLFKCPKYFYMTFQMSPEVCMTLHDLLRFEIHYQCYINYHRQHSYALLVGLTHFPTQQLFHSFTVIQTK